MERHRLSRRFGGRLTSERPYKRAFSEQETLEILLKECDEGKWDPELIDQFQRFLNE